MDRPDFEQPISFRPQTVHRHDDIETTGYAFSSLPPLALYIHIPWCIRKCPYCDFNSHEVGTNHFQEAIYIDALIADLEQELPRVWGRTIDSIFFGGGTPSLFSPESIDRLLSHIRALLPLRPGLEVSMEANPGALEHGAFCAYREAGISRVSIGVQSFDDHCLTAIGRIHHAESAITACKEASSAEFDSWNIDLMFALPGQEVDVALADVEKAIALNPGHISCYQLTLEPNTLFHHNPPVLPGEDQQWEMQEAIQGRLKENGYRQYEISAFSRTGHQCVHNRNYWRFGDYIGIGAGAHGKLTIGSEQQIIRYAKQRHPDRYMELAGTTSRISHTSHPSPKDTLFEYLMNACRLNEGIDLSEMAQRTGIHDLAIIDNRLDQLAGRGMIRRSDTTIQVTELGHRFLNDLLQSFIP